MNSLLLMFIGLSVINVIFSTVRSLLTIKGGKGLASLISGGYYAFYNIMLIYTVANFPMWQKCVITFVCNVIGVWIVKFIEEKLTKEKLWKIEMTVRNHHAPALHKELNSSDIPHNFIEVGKYTVFNCYCATQMESAIAKGLGESHRAKFFATESKIL